MNKTRSRGGNPAPALIHETYTCSLANGTVEWGFCFKKPESDDIEFDLVIDAAPPDVATAERINADFARMAWAAQAVCAAAVNNVHAMAIQMATQPKARSFGELMPLSDTTFPWVVMRRTCQSSDQYLGRLPASSAELEAYKIACGMAPEDIYVLQGR